MAGETKASISGWTVDTAKAHLEQRIDELEKRLGAAIEHVEAMAQQADKTSQTAIDKAEAGDKIRFESVNEFRKTLSDQAGSFLTRQAFEESQKANYSYRDVVTGRLDVISKWMSSRDGELVAKKERTETGIAHLTIIVAAVSAIVTVMVSVALSVFRNAN